MSPELAALHQAWARAPLQRLAAHLPEADCAALAARVEAELQPQRHGDLLHWEALLAGLPEVKSEHVRLDQPEVELGAAAAVSDPQRQQLRALLQELRPWRKGPFSVFGERVDAEWRSDLKWARVQSAVDVSGARVLDVGSGNGYSSLRALGAGAAAVLAIDPGLLAVTQFHALTRSLSRELPVALLPLKLEQLPPGLAGYDIVLSMGVLSHRRDPEQHLAELRPLLRPGGSLVLETLVIEANGAQLLVPEGRYAAMRNVWLLPSPPLVLHWLAEAGFGQARLVDISRTEPREQRSTEWMTGPSLADFLDPEDPTRTREGHPAPRRALFHVAGV